MKNQLVAKTQKRLADSISAVTSQSTTNKYFELAASELKSFAEKGIEAGILNNFKKIMDSDAGQAITMSSDFGPYVQEIWPVVTAWYPDFPLKDLVSVQDMDKPLAYLFFSKLQTGTTKGNSPVGSTVETALGIRQIKGNYPTGEVLGEEIPAAQLEFDNADDQTVGLLAYAPLNLTADYLSKIKIVVTVEAGSLIGGTFIPLSVIGDKLSLAKSTTPTVDSGHWIDIQTGALYLQEATGASASTVTKVVCNYVWNLDYATQVTIPKVKEEIESLPMEALPRALSMEWTLFSEYLKKSQFGIDIREENTKRILNLLYQFQVRYVLDTMFEYNQGTSDQTLTIPSATTMSVEVKSQVVSQQLKSIANIIELASGRIEGNRIVCGKHLKTFLESLPNTLFQPELQPSGFSGPRLIGQYGTFKVYYDNAREDGEAFMTYRGDEWYDASYYLGIYMPMVPTDAIALGVTVRESFVSMEAHKYHKPNCVIPFTVSYAA